ncbi:MAG TPA: hypothetical protein VK129_08835, partial [Terriglobales bacterium]|nr:hypothetical protein [Terriglobales bacterium]
QLNLSADLKADLSLRAAHISSVDDAATFQLQRIGRDWKRERKSHDKNPPNTASRETHHCLSPSPKMILREAGPQAGPDVCWVIPAIRGETRPVDGSPSHKSTPQRARDSAHSQPARKSSRRGDRRDTPPASRPRWAAGTL